jgi:hypothetical protein
VNRLTKYCRLEQGKKFKRSKLHLWQRAPQPANKPNHRCLRKPWERSPRPFNQQLGRRGAVRDSLATAVAKSAMRAASSQIGRQLVRGILGGILGGSGSRRR